MGSQIGSPGRLLKSTDRISRRNRDHLNGVSKRIVAGTKNQMQLQNPYNLQNDNILPKYPQTMARNAENRLQNNQPSNNPNRFSQDQNNAYSTNKRYRVEMGKMNKQTSLPNFSGQIPSRDQARLNRDMTQALLKNDTNLRESLDYPDTSFNNLRGIKAANQIGQ